MNFLIILFSNFFCFTLLPVEIEITNNNLLETIPRLSTEWSISFEYRQTSLVKGWRNLIRFAVSGIPFSSPTVMESRIPAVFVLSNSTTLLFSTSINGSCYNVNAKAIENEVNENQHVEIHQRYVSQGDYRFFIKINGIEIHSVINSGAQQFYNVDVYASDNFHKNAAGYISNFLFTNFL